MRFSPSPDDFEVEEVPLAPPAGAGPHLSLLVEKRGIATPEAIRRLADRLGTSAAAVGHAGLKDAHARTTQRLSVAWPEGAPLPDLAALGDDRLRVLAAERDARKLALGALAGNRFVLRFRDVSPEDEARARAALARFAADGVPNFFGAQRFGIRGNSGAIGRAILVGEARLALDLLLGCPRAWEGERLRAARARYERQDLAGALRGFPPSFEPERRALEALLAGARPAAAIEAMPWKAREVYLSAYQAELFNRLLAARVAAGTYVAIEPGDATVEVAPGVLSPAGPLYGYDMPHASGEPGAREARLLAAEGIGWETWRRPAGLALRGVRRAYRFELRELSIESGTEAATPGNAGTLTVRFFLPPGSYATTVADRIDATRPPGLPGRADRSPGR